MKVRKLSSYAKRILTGPTASLDVQLLMKYVLGLEEELLFCDHNLTVKEKRCFNSLLARRMKGEPIAKIIGKKSFWDYNFIVNSYTLDPRPDSETMIEYILEVFNITDGLHILDLGTGSGCLLLTLLKLYKNADGVAVDINENTLATAKQNATLLGVMQRTKFIVSDWNKSINDKFDIIISNPPYIETDAIKHLSRDVQYDPIEALDGGKDGLNCYRSIATNIMKNCLQNTNIFIEIGDGQMNAVKNIFLLNNFKYIGSKKDLSGKERILRFAIDA